MLEEGDIQILSTAGNTNANYQKVQTKVVKSVWKVHSFVTLIHTFMLSQIYVHGCKIIVFKDLIITLSQYLQFSYFLSFTSVCYLFCVCVRLVCVVGLCGQSIFHSYINYILVFFHLCVNIQEYPAENKVNDLVWDAQSLVKILLHYNPLGTEYDDDTNAVV